MAQDEEVFEQDEVFIIQHLWRDVFATNLSSFYYLFHSMDDGD